MRAKFILLSIILSLGTCYFLIFNVILRDYKIMIVQQSKKTTFATKLKNTAKNKLTSTSTQSETETRSYEEIIYDLEKRRIRVRYMCDTVDGAKEKVTSAYRKAISNVIVNRKHKLTWCPIYKAASSLWMKNFAYLSGLSLDRDLVSTTLIKYDSIIEQKYRHSDDLVQKLNEMNDTIKFMMVRHPFERLLSAYRDKLEHMQDRTFYYARYGKYIKNKYRVKHSNITDPEPTFEEFLKFLANEKIFDEHWNPFFVSCQPCFIDYDYIFKFEALREEYDFFLNKCNLTTDQVDRIVDEKNNATNDLVSEKYFRNIPRSLLKRIFKIYELDFLLFSYSPVKYYYMSDDSR